MHESKKHFVNQTAVLIPIELLHAQSFLDFKSYLDYYMSFY